jgi:glycosyltransferase involved in cell wall biosynthesis
VRLLELIPHTEAVDGVQRAAFDLTRALAANGHHAQVAALRHGTNATAWSGEARLLGPAPALALSPRRPWRMAGTASLAAQVDGPIDVVVAHRVDLLNSAALLAVAFRARLVLHAHNAPPPWMRWSDWRRVPGARRVDRVVVASEYMREIWHDLVGAGPPVQTVEYPIDTTHFAVPTATERATARAQIGLEPAELAIGYVGRIDPEKGLHVLGAAVQRLSDTVDGVHVVIQGAANVGVDDRAAADYRRRCEESLAGVRSTWLGASPDVRPVMRAADVLVVPSVWQEPSGLTVSEGLAMGTPLVASAVGGIPAQMPQSDSRLARLVPPDDPVALADALAQVTAVAPGEEERIRLHRHVEAARAMRPIGRRYAIALAS